MTGFETFDGPCPFLFCDEPEKHAHPTCPTCGAVRYGNLSCETCRAVRAINPNPVILLTGRRAR